MADSTTPARFNDSDDALIETSLKRFQITAEAEADLREVSMDDLKFSIGEQWAPSIKASRDVEGKPCLVMNRIPALMRQYTGEERQQRPAMTVDPVGSGSDIEVAKINQGVLRHIEVASFADVTYDANYDWMLRTGWSYWTIENVYLSDEPGENDDAFAQEPRIGFIENPFAVYMSPFRRPDGTDPLWCHIVEDMSKDEYREKYPDSPLGTRSRLKTFEIASRTGNAPPGWVTKDGIRTAFYWWLELQKRTLCLLPDGSTQYADQLSKRQQDSCEDEREVVARKVCCVKHNAVEVLERYEWLGTIIPVVPIDGTKLNVNGKIYKAGMVRDAKDPQRVYNFEITSSVEQVALAPKNPLFVAEKSIENHEEEYKNANRRSYAYLPYKAYDAEGKQLPSPFRDPHEPPIQAMSQLVKQADYDLKSIVGLYEAALGEQGPAQESGFAVLQRQTRSDVASINWSDNLNRAIRYQGKILLDLYPKLITRARVQRIINPDDTVKHVVVYSSQHSEPDEANALLDGDALNKIYDIGSGKYDVTLSAGPQYRTARQEASRAMLALVAAQPELFQIIGDVMVQNMDWPGAEVIAERLRKLLPPNLQADGTDKDSQIAQLSSQLQAFSQQHQLLTGELARATDTIRTKRLDVESRERVANLNAQVQLTLQAMKDHGAASQSQLQAVLDAISHRLELLHESMAVDQEAGPQPATPELPNSVEPKVQPIAPAAPVPNPLNQ